MNFATELERFGDQIALISDQGEKLSYTELAALSDSIFTSNSAPVAPALVAIECDNSLIKIAAYLGALRAGIPALLVDGKLDVSLKEALYSHYGITDICLGHHWLVRPEVKSIDVHPDVALLLSTSGSTGSQKLVKLSNQNLHSNAVAIAEYLGITVDERPITVLPIHYSYGLSVINSHLVVGATLLVTSEPVTSKHFWLFFKEHAATSFSGVPATYKMLKQLRFERMDLPSLTNFTQAGGRLVPDLVEWFNHYAVNTGRRFFVMYGQTEATARIAFVPFELLGEKKSSIGIAIPRGTLSLIDEAGNEIDNSHVKGELCYYGENVMMGYATDIFSLSEPDSQNGFLATGDLAWRDEDGYYFIAGRLKRFIKIFGNRIGLDEVEAQLQSEGLDIVVTGEDDALMIAVRSNCNLSDLKTNIAQRYHFHPSAIHLFTVDDFPLTSTGKVRYADLLEQLKLQK